MMRFCLFMTVLGLCYSASKAECTSRGRFPNNDELECRGYTMCLPGSGGYIQYKLTCPQGSVYSHTEQQCTTATTYQCYPDYFCFAPGDFKFNCNSFVSCVTGLNGIVTARRTMCPSNQVFIPGKGCLEGTDYKCEEITTELTIVGITKEVATTMPEVPNVHPVSETPKNRAGSQTNSVFGILLICYFIRSL